MFSGFRSVCASRCSWRTDHHKNTKTSRELVATMTGQLSHLTSVGSHIPSVQTECSQARNMHVQDVAHEKLIKNLTLTCPQLTRSSTYYNDKRSNTIINWQIKQQTTDTLHSQIQKLSSYSYDNTGQHNSVLTRCHQQLHLSQWLFHFLFRLSTNLRYFTDT